MTIWYLDPISGNDANAGTSWGTAFKTFAAGPTVAKGLLAGDTIRVAKSPDPVSIGTATWTSRKVSNSITFDSPVSKTIDLCKAGWASSVGTVTNNQSTAAVTEAVFGSNSPTCVQNVLSANSGKVLYKNLGSVQDFSAYQQVSLWVRCTVALDLSGANNMTVALCSDTLGATAVNTLTFPKFSMAAGTWYPIVIDNGSALGSNIQSVSINTGAMTITGTLYIDEIFATPAGGLTLWSLIGDNDSAWYPIKTVRGADVQLIPYFPSNATAIVGSSNASQPSESWNGTTANFTTYKRETTKMYTALGSTTPSSVTFCTTLQSGVWSNGAKNLINYSFGWNTSSGSQDGLTFIDNIAQLGTCFTFAHSNIRIENLIPVRVLTGMNNTTYGCEISNVGGIGCNQPFQLSSSAFPSYNNLSVNKTMNLGSFTCNAMPPGFSPSTGAAQIGWTINFGKCILNPLGPSLQNFYNSTINFVRGIIVDSNNNLIGNGYIDQFASTKLAMQNTVNIIDINESIKNKE